jgi:hypothetical protein
VAQSTYYPNSAGGAAWRGLNATVPGASLAVWQDTAYSAAEENTISADDANYVRQSGSGSDYPGHEVLYNAVELREAVTQLDFTVKFATGGASATVYVWNFDTSAWDAQASQGGVGIRTVTFSLSASVSSYLNAVGQFYVLVATPNIVNLDLYFEQVVVTYTQDFSVEVAASFDDALYNNTTGVWNRTGAYNTIGKDSTPQSRDCWVRFLGVNVPKGATINAAWLTFCASAVVSGATVVAKIRAQAEDDATQIPDAGTYTGMTWTTQQVAWSPAAWTGDAWYSSPDIKDVVQEVVDRAGWVSGNAMGFQVADNGSSNNAQRRPVAWDTDPAKAAWLNINFTPPPTTTTSTTPELPTTSTTPEPTTTPEATTTPEPPPTTEEPTTTTTPEPGLKVYIDGVLCTAFVVRRITTSYVGPWTAELFYPGRHDVGG